VNSLFNSYNILPIIDKDRPLREEQGAHGNIWMEERGSNMRMEKRHSE
jgi:hypothetical protein